MRRAGLLVCLVLFCGCSFGTTVSSASTTRTKQSPTPIFDGAADQSAPTPQLPAGEKTLHIPILMYHYIRNYPDRRQDYLGYNLSVSPQDFTTQMDWLQQHGYESVTFDQIAAYFAGSGTLPEKP